MTNLKADPLVQFLRMEYRAIVVQELDVELALPCPGHAKAACGEGVAPTPALCAGMPGQGRMPGDRPGGRRPGCRSGAV